jgi:2-oxoisovalerate dehydrogenase E1 component alpha subunit
MMNQIYSNKGDRLKGRQLPIMYSAKDASFFSISGNLATQVPQAVGWAMASAAGATRASRQAGAAKVLPRKAISTPRFDLCDRLQRAPVIMNVVNNQWAISSSSPALQARESTTFAARAVGYGIAGHQG